MDRHGARPPPPHSPEEPTRMSVKPVFITTFHDETSFDPETHRAPAAEQLGLDPDAIQCTATGPDDFTCTQESLYSEDGTLLKPRIVKYHRRTTWEPRPTVVRAKEAPREPPPPENHEQPKLARGARWHGVVDGKEGNYISDGDKLHHVDSAEAKTLAAVLKAEADGYQAGIGSVVVGK